MQVVNTWRPELDGGSMSTHYVLFVLTDEINWDLEESDNG